MDKITVIIPTAGEVFLQKTIDGILEAATGELDIIVYLDDYWPVPPIVDNPRVTIIHSARVGMFEAINASVRITNSKYILKSDAHCIFEKGFDEKLKADCEDNWLVVPRRYDLDADKWERGNKITDYMYITPPEKRPADSSQCWDWGFAGVRGTTPISVEANLIDDLMTFQGSCWFMTKKYYEDIGGLDLGTFWLEAQHLGNKVWLSGGRVIRNKKTWYAHLHKGKKFERGYSMSKSSVNVKREIIDFWMNNRWDKRTKDFKWLIDKFSPAGWENWDWSKEWRESQLPFPKGKGLCGDVQRKS